MPDEITAAAGGADTGNSAGAVKTLADFYPGGNSAGDGGAAPTGNEANGDNAPTNKGDTGQDAGESGTGKEVPGLGDRADKPAAPEPGKDKPPTGGDAAEYTPKFPEGFEVDQNALELFKNYAKENKLSPEVFQKGIDLQVELSKKQAAAVQSRRAALDAEFRAAVKDDPDFGGAKHQATMDSAEWALARYGDSELLSRLREWGVQNHPVIVKLLARVGMAHNENQSPKGAPPAKTAAAKEKKSLVDFYDDMPE